MRPHGNVGVGCARLNSKAGGRMVVWRALDRAVIVLKAAFGAGAAVVGGGREVQVKRQRNGDGDGAGSEDAPPGGTEEQGRDNHAKQPSRQDGPDRKSTRLNSSH